MARYGQEYGRNFDRWNSMGNQPSRGMNPGYGGNRYGGMRSDAGGNNWRDFRGEEGWAGGRSGRGYDRDFGGYGGGGRGMVGGYQGGAGGYRGGGMEYAGYGGRGAGYETGREWGQGERGGYSDFGGGRGGVGERTRASDIMTENPEAVTPDSTLAEVAQKMKDLDVGIIPVVDSRESRKLRGVITDRDIAIRAVAEGKDGKAKVSDCMSSDVETCNKNDSVDRVLQLMERERVRRVPITDREGRLVGIIAQADLAVDYGDEGPRRGRRVQEAIETISEPARPEREGRGMAAKGRSSGGGSRQGQSQDEGQQ